MCSNIRTYIYVHIHVYCSTSHGHLCIQNNSLYKHASVIILCTLYYTSLKKSLIDSSLVVQFEDEMKQCDELLNLIVAHMDPVQV